MRRSRGKADSGSTPAKPFGPDLVRVWSAQGCEMITNTAQPWRVKRLEVIEGSEVCPGGGGWLAFPYKEEAGGSSPSTPTGEHLSWLGFPSFRPCGGAPWSASGPRHRFLCAHCLPFDVARSSPGKRSVVRARQRPQRKASILLGFLRFRYSDDNAMDAHRTRFALTRFARRASPQPPRRPLVQGPIHVEHGPD